jgi:hypothetical protein
MGAAGDQPLAVPNVGIAHDTHCYVGDIKVELRAVNIHSEDGLVIYLPNDRTLRAIRSRIPSRSSPSRGMSSRITTTCRH